MADLELEDLSFDDIAVDEDVFTEAEIVFVTSQHSKCTQILHTMFLGFSTPLRMWFFFTLCNFLNYVDRGAFAGALTSIEKDFIITETQAGMLGGTWNRTEMI